jgi:hypothetical protein
MTVPGKVCSRYVTRYWKERRARGRKKLFEFLMAYAKPSPEERKHYEFMTGRKAPKPLTKKEREAWAKKMLAQIEGRGLPTPFMFMFCDLLEEWWAKEKKKRAKQNWKKALKTIERKKDAALMAAIASFEEQGRKDNEALGFS